LPPGSGGDEGDEGDGADELGNTIWLLRGGG
jgi:hypothetical protein